MDSVKNRGRMLLLCLALLPVPPLLLCGCDIGDDLVPSGSDQRPAVTPGTTGAGVGQIAPGFTLPDTLGDNVTLSGSLASSKAVVLYFVMWCPVCDSHMSHMRSVVIPASPDVRFLAVDYVSGSVADARNAEVSNGYAGSRFTFLVDIGNAVLHSYSATMGTTVVIDNTGVIRMNEDYRNGVNLQTVLAGLP